MSRLSLGLTSASFAIGLFAAATASAQSHDMHAHAGHTMAAPEASQDALADGEIKKVDKDTGRLTVQHGPLLNLNMPGMTMVFKVQDPAMLEQVKAGDKVRLRVERVNGAFTVTKLEPAN